MTYLGLALLFLVLTAWYTYSGFFTKPRPWQFLGQAAAIIFGFLTLFCGYAMWQAHQAVPILSTYIDPYPRVTETMWVPSLSAKDAEYINKADPWIQITPDSDRSAKTWIFKTKDSPEAVRQFYLADAQRRGWTLELGAGREEPPLLILKKERARLTIGFTPEWGGGTSIIYMLKEIGS